MKRIRAVVSGDASVGKSSIISRFITGEFRSNAQQTVGGSFHSQYVKTANREDLCIELWDTAGSERYRSVIPSFFRNAAAVVIVYDISKRDTFKNLEYWLEFVREHSPHGVAILLAGNKTDLDEQREVTTEEGHDFSKQHECTYFVEVSAATGENIDNLFAMLATVPPNGAAEMEVTQDQVEKKAGCGC